MLVDDGDVCGEEGGRSGFYKLENLFGAWPPLGVWCAGGRGMYGGRRGEIVKEDPAYASTLAAVGDGEVLVALLLEIGPVALVVLVTRLLERLVEMDGIGLVEVGRGEVGSAAKPPRFRFPGDGVFNLKVPVVEMDGGHVWVPGVDDDAEAGCEEGDGAGGFRQARVVRQHGLLGLGREFTVDDGDVDTGFFKDAAVGEDAGGAFAAFGADPGVAQECGRGGGRGEFVGRGGGFDVFHGVDDVVLQRLDPGGHADAHRVLPGVSEQHLINRGGAYSRVVVFDGVGGLPGEAVCVDGVDGGHGVAAGDVLGGVSSCRYRDAIWGDVHYLCSAV